MPCFKILPTDLSRSAAQITALDAGAVLNVISQLQVREADILRDDTYSFSVRLGDNGLWSIFQREVAPWRKHIQPFG